MTDRKAIEARIHLFMTNIRKGLSYDANVVLLTNDIEQGQRDLLIAFATYMEEDKKYARHDEANVEDFLEKNSN